MYRLLWLLLFPVLACAQTVELAWDDPGWVNPVEIQVESSPDGSTWNMVGCAASGQTTLTVSGSAPVRFRARAMEPGPGAAGLCDTANAMRISGWSNVAVAVAPYKDVTVTIPIQKEIPWTIKPNFGQAQIDWANPANKNLVAWWLFNEGAGTLVRDLTGRSPATLTNVDPATIWSSSALGPTVKWDGVNDHAQISHNAELNITGDLTMHFRLNWNTFVGGAKTLIQKTATYTDQPYQARLDGAGRLVFEHANSGSAGFVTSSAIIANNIWYEVWIVRSGTNLKIYLRQEGEALILDTNTTIAASAGGNTETLALATGEPLNPTDSPFNGTFGDVRLWSRAWTQSEIEACGPQNPFCGLVERRVFTFIPSAAATGTVDQGLLLFKGGLPAFTNTRTKIPSAGLLSFKGFEPTTSNQVAKAVDQGLLLFNGGSVDFANLLNLGVERGLLSFEGGAPAFNVDSRLLQLDAGLLAFQGGEPILQALVTQELLTLYRTFPWTVKPPYGQTEINWASRHAIGLKHAFAFNEGSGQPTDLVTGVRTTDLGSGSPPWITLEDGPALDFAGTNNSKGFSTLNPSVVGTNARTWTAVVIPDGFGTGTQRRILGNFGTVNGEGWYLYAEDNGFSVGVSGHRVIFAKGTLSTGTRYVVSVGAPAGASSDAIEGWINGVSYSQATEFGTAQTLNSLQSDLNIGGENGTENFDGSIILVFLHARAPGPWLADFHRDLYGIFESATGRLFFQPTQQIDVSQGLLNLKGGLPGFNVDSRLLLPNQGVLAFKGGVPVVVSAGTIVTVDQGLLLFKGGIPGVISTRNLQVDQGLLSFQGQPPGSLTQRNIAPNRGVLLFKGDIPAVVSGRTLTVNRGVLLFKGASPDFSNIVNIDVDQGVLTLNGQPVDFVLGGVITTTLDSGRLVFKTGAPGESVMLWAGVDEVSGTWSAVQTVGGNWVLIRGRDA